jgi:hypothetical protein
MTSYYISALGMEVELRHFFYLTRLSQPIFQQENMVAGKNIEFIRLRPTSRANTIGTLLANQECLFRLHLHAIG